MLEKDAETNNNFSRQKFKKKAKGIMMVTKLMKSTSEDSHGKADIRWNRNKRFWNIFCSIHSSR